MLWILTLAKARSAAPISAAILTKRATRVGAKINATLRGARQKGSWRRRSLVTAQYGDAPHSLLAICPSASTRDPLQYFNSLLRTVASCVRQVGWSAFLCIPARKPQTDQAEPDHDRTPEKVDIPA